MRAKQIGFLAGVGLILGGLLASAAWAEEPDRAVMDSEFSLPAVDGLNASLSGFGGRTEGVTYYGGAGSVSVPLGHRFGLEIDGIGAGFDRRFGGTAELAGVAAHLFWRDPSVGMLGAFGGYFHTDFLGDADVYAAALEGALYLGRFTLTGMAGAQDGEVDFGTAGSFDLGTRFFDVEKLSYYPLDDLELSLGHSYLFGLHAAQLGAEWGFAARGGTMATLFVGGSLQEGGDGSAFGGLRLYFGQSAKTLIRRHREDDPIPVYEANYARMWYQAAAAMEAYEGHAATTPGGGLTIPSFVANLLGINVRRR